VGDKRKRRGKTQAKINYDSKEAIKDIIHTVLIPKTRSSSMKGMKSLFS